MAGENDALKLLFVKLGFSVDEDQLKKANQKYTELKSKLDLGVGAAKLAWGAVKALTTEYSEQAMAVRATATQLGITTDQLQELQHAANVTESSAAAMNRGLLFLSRNASAAAGGSKEAADGFQRLGVRLKDADGKLRSPAELIYDVADGLQRMPDGTEKAALAMKMFGRGGAELVPVLNGGREGLRALGVEARELGVVLSKDAIAAAAKFDDAMDLLKASGKGVWNTIGGALMPVATGIVTSINKWIRANRALISTRIHQAVDLATKALTTMKQVLDPVLGLLGAVARSTTALKTVFICLAVVMAGKLAIALGGAIAGMTGLSAAQMAANASALLLGLKWLALGAIFALVFEDLYTWIEGGESMFGLLSESIDRMWESATYDPKKTGWGEALDFLKSMLWTVTHIGETFEEWGSLLKGEGAVFNYLNARNRALFGVDQAPAAAGGPSAAAAGVSGPVFADALGMGQATSSGAPAAAAGPINVQLNMPVTSSANPADIANAVRPVVRDELGTVLREAAATRR